MNRLLAALGLAWLIRRAFSWPRVDAFDDTLTVTGRRWDVHVSPEFGYARFDDSMVAYRHVDGVLAESIAERPHWFVGRYVIVLGTRHALTGAR